MYSSSRIWLVELGDAGVVTAGSPARFGAGQIERHRLRLNRIEKRLTLREVFGCVRRASFRAIPSDSSSPRYSPALVTGGVR